MSPMPEGLLDALTLEEVKDLFAFVRGEQAPGAGEDARADEASEWVALFRGRQRSGWRHDERWREKGGVLVGSSPGIERTSWILSKGSFDDFEAEFDVWLSGGNSGFQYRSALPDGGEPVGYQLDLGLGDWGSLYASDGRGTLASGRGWHAVVDLAGWNHVHLRAEGDRHVIEINGAVLADVRDGAHASGVIGFQLHEGAAMEVRIANARIRPLGR